MISDLDIFDQQKQEFQARRDPAASEADQTPIYRSAVFRFYAAIILIHSLLVGAAMIWTRPSEEQRSSASKPADFVTVMPLP